jgi:hypothetical protein
MTELAHFSSPRGQSDTAATPTTYRRAAISVALLFLTSTVTFLIGSALIDEFFAGSTTDRTSLIIGVLLEAYTGLAVAAIGFIVLPILRTFGKRLADGYLALRSIEALIIIGIGAYFIASRKYVENYDSFIYVATGSGGLMFSVLLYRSKLVPRWLSLLGVVGYCILLSGVMGVALNQVDFDTTSGMMFFVPGGLFEVLLPLILLVRGFRR